MLLELFEELSRHKQRQRDIEKGNPVANKDEGGESDVGKYEGYPWVHGGLTQTSKGLPKGEIADDVEGTVVVPSVHVDTGLAIVCLFTESLDE